jgi:hypothetical protein
MVEIVLLEVISPEDVEEMEVQVVAVQQEVLEEQTIMDLRITELQEQLAQEETVVAVAVLELVAMNVLQIMPEQLGLAARQPVLPEAMLEIEETKAIQVQMALMVLMELMEFLE